MGIWKKGVRFSDKNPDIIKPECDMIIYLPLPEDVYKVDKWRVGEGVIGVTEVWISRGWSRRN